MRFLNDRLIKADRELLLLGAVVFIVNLVVYSGALDNGFLSRWDDNLYVTGNLDIQGFNLVNLKAIFSSFYVGNYAPAQMLSYMLDFELWGLNPFGFILTNIVLNGLNGILLCLILSQFRVRSSLILIAVLLFLIHPVQVESVAWVSQRKNLLAMFFFLQAFFFYQRYVAKPEHRRSYYLLSNAAFLLALLAKSVTVILPVILFAYDLLFRKNGALKHFLLEKIPYGLMSLAAIALTLVSQDPAEGGGMVSTFHGGSAYHTFLTMLTVFKDYLVHLFWPFGLSAQYEPVIRSVWDLNVVCSLMLLCGVALLPQLLLKDRRFAWFWMIVFFVALLPVSQIVPLITLMNDRYLYFPMLGVAGLVVAFAQELPRKLDKPVIAIALTVLILLGIGAYQRTQVWAGSVPLWSDVTEKQPKSFTARYGLGLAYYDEQEYLRATQQFRAALKIKPADGNALYGLGLALLADGRFRQAEPIFVELVQQRPLDPVLLRLAGHIQYFQGHWLQARQYYEREVMVAGATASSLNYLSLIEQRAGFAQESAKRFAQALDAGATAGELYLERARLESLARNRQAALAYLTLALEAGVDSIESLREDPDLRYVQQTAEFERLLSSAQH